jgi:hypothetical protein
MKFNLRLAAGQFEYVYINVWIKITLILEEGMENTELTESIYMVDNSDNEKSLV